MDEKEDRISVSLITGRLVSNIPNNSIGIELELASSSVDLELTEFVEQVPVQLLHAGDHFHELGDCHKKKQVIRSQTDPLLPRQTL